MLRHGEADVGDWVGAAKALLRDGEVERANEVVRRAGRSLGRGEKGEFERRWGGVLDGQE